MSGASARRLVQTVDDGASTVSGALVEDLVLSDALDARSGELVACDVIRDLSCFVKLFACVMFCMGCCVRCFVDLFCLC